MSGTKKKFLAVQKALKKTPLHFFSVSFGPEKMVKVDKKKGYTSLGNTHNTTPNP